MRNKDAHACDRQQDEPGACGNDSSNGPKPEHSQLFKEQHVKSGRAFAAFKDGEMK